MWQTIWFIVNTLFVGSLIITLFTQRAVSMAFYENADQQKITRLKRVRLFMWVTTTVLLLAMSFSFIMNMRVNG